MKTTREKQRILESTAAFGSHGCFCCKRNFSRINKMVSAVSPPSPRPDLLFSSPLTLEYTAREPGGKKGRGCRATGHDEKTHCTLMKQFLSGWTRYNRLIIWSNYMDKIWRQIFTALSKRFKRSRQQFAQQKTNQQLMTMPHKMK